MHPEPYAGAFHHDCASLHQCRCCPFTHAGVVGFVGPQDIPAGPDAAVMAPDPEPLFAWKTVEYVGQPLGLVLATTQSAAREAAQRVRVVYSDADDAHSAGHGGIGTAAADAAAGNAAGAADQQGIKVASTGMDCTSAAHELLTSLPAAVAANSWYEISSPFWVLKAVKGETYSIKVHTAVYWSQ